tara:strand:- start:874 stop:1677 length:804 start_codon:yes stop_codon:yes gene_type:complete
MKIVSWNVAGLRAMLKKPTFDEYIFGDQGNIDILCLQETKAEEKQVQLNEKIIEKYPYRYWNSTKGITQRKGLSGVSIWCTSPPIKVLENPEWDEEGRIFALEFQDFVLINVYVPNSQNLEGQRYYFREKWNSQFSQYITDFISEYLDKDIIICGDMNVAHLNNDISNPKQKKNKVPGFFDNERSDFAYLLEINNLIDIFRYFNPEKRKSTYWSNFIKGNRNKENGWGIDYFVCSPNFMTKQDISCNILMDIMGSDHCPIELIFDSK